MTIADVQSVAGSTATSYALPAFAVNAVAGDCIVVGIQYFFDPGTALAPTDSRGNTYTQVGTKQSNGNGAYLVMWKAQNVAAGATTVTVNQVASVYPTAVAWLLTSMHATPYNGDVFGTTGNGATATIGPTTTPPAANSIFLSIFGYSTSAGVTVPTGYNTTGVNGYTAGMDAVAARANGAAATKLFSAYKIGSAVESPAWATSSQPWAGLTASFAPAPPPVPTLTSAAPAQGTTAGGTPVTLTGTNITSDATVTFGGVAATSVVFVDATTVTCVSPAGAAGTAVITLTQVSGSASLAAAAWTYKLQPFVTNVVPQYSTVAGGVAVTITGTNFINGATVDFGGAAATSVVFVNSTTITCVTPVHAAGQITVTVTNP